MEVAEEVAGPIDLGAVRPGTPVARNDLGCIHLDRSQADLQTDRHCTAREVVAVHRSLRLRSDRLDALLEDPGSPGSDRAVGGDGIAGRDTRLLEARCRSQIAEEAGQSTVGATAERIRLGFLAHTAQGLVECRSAQRR